MVYKIDLTSPDYFWQLRKIEKEVYGKTSNCNSTVRRIDKPSDGDRQGRSLWGELRSPELDVRIQQEGIAANKNGSPNIRSVHDASDNNGC